MTGAMAQSPSTLMLYNPTGAFQVTQAFSPRLADLNDKTICEVSDDSWETDRTFPVIRQLLQKQFPTAKIVTYDKLPILDTKVDIPGLEDAVKKAGCQAAIVGNAG
jgi:ABC-type amino acid transport substrate-binding protein